jgi:hypothetical protein
MRSGRRTSSGSSSPPVHLGDSTTASSIRAFLVRPWVELKATDYRIVVTGELGSRYAASFEPMQLVPREGMTEIVGRIEDDAQLTGLLDTVAALGLSLVSVAPVAANDDRALPADGAARTPPLTVDSPG